MDETKLSEIEIWCETGDLSGRIARELVAEVRRLLHGIDSLADIIDEYVEDKDLYNLIEAKRRIVDQFPILGR